MAHSGIGLHRRLTSIASARTGCPHALLTPRFPACHGGAASNRPCATVGNEMDASPFKSASRCATLVVALTSHKRRRPQWIFKVLGIDLANNVFQLCALNQAGKVLFNRQVRRNKLRASVAQLEPTTIAMEACSSAHYWGRVFEAMGHRVVPARIPVPIPRPESGGRSPPRSRPDRSAADPRWQCTATA